MLIDVKVIPNASRNELNLLNTDNNSFKIKVMRPAQDGKANEQVCELLAKYFNVSKRDVYLVSGEHSRTKKYEINLTTK